MSEKLLEIDRLKVYYPVRAKSILPKKVYVKAVDGISFCVYKNEVLGIVGESGCGKSTTGHAIVGLVKPTEGQILYDGEDLAALRKKNRRDLARRIQIIFQDPYSSLDARFTIGRCIAEPMVVQKTMTKEEILERTLQLMREVGLNDEQITRYPHEFSGGQRQRVGIARALAMNPELIICDEPVSALDVSIQAQILNLMKELKENRGLTYIFISHNLSVVHHICDRVVVMYLGNIVEVAQKEQLFSSPRHPYTQALLDAIPIPDPRIDSMNTQLEGDVPSPLHPPEGCCFHTRCKYATEECARCKPASVEVEEGHFVACHHLDALRRKD